MPRVRAGVRCVSSVGVSSTAAAPPVPSDDELTGSYRRRAISGEVSCKIERERAHVRVRPHELNSAHEQKGRSFLSERFHLAKEGGLDLSCLDGYRPHVEATINNGG